MGLDVVKDVKSRPKLRCKSIPARVPNTLPNSVILRLKTNAIRNRRLCIYLKCIFGAIGIVFMIVEGELFISKTLEKDSFASNALKSVISISTAILLLFIILQHKYQRRIEQYFNRHRKWRWCVEMIIEILVCIVHPFPGSMKIPKPLQTMSKESSELTRDHVYLDGYLSLFMIFRFYLFGQLISELLSSQLFSNRTLAKHLAGLTSVRLNSAFIMKYLLFRYPFKFVIAILMIVLITNSYAMQTCESYTFPGSEMTSFLNSLWLVMITFLTIGYGDFYPVSFCGRCVSASTGFLGIGLTGFIFSVFVHQFEMNRDEKYLLKFSKEEKRKQQRRIAASNVIKCFYKAAKSKGQKSKYQVWKVKFWKAVSVMRRSAKKCKYYHDIDLVDIQRTVQNIEKRQNEILNLLSHLRDNRMTDENSNTSL
ncbi:small conductance calcium-activated potassium channel protein 2-like [Saccostrea echinata]|uniref:small conductance calcium-activated potassium channel protein 2-like n=1 Tax=Saccostrea echinata TaxID=191078 RepID=UPI002A83276B|nr:small conductance calcium-activated potassium channel protein 2-like [Saccostrea echinata]